MRDIIERHLAAIEAGDWDAYQASYAEDATYDELATREQRSGPEEITALMKKWKQAFPDLKGTIRDCFEAGDKVLVEVEWDGTHEGPLEGPFGTMQPTGRHGSVQAALVLTLRDDKIVANHHYFDLMTVMAQIGMGAPAEEEAASPPPVH